MRTYVTLEPGQIWRSSDLRRQFTTYFVIDRVRGDLVDVFYGISKRAGTLERDAFRMTGSRGYVRES